MGKEKRAFSPGQTLFANQENISDCPNPVSFLGCKGEKGIISVREGSWHLPIKL